MRAALRALLALAIAGCAVDQQADVDAYRAIADPPGAPPTHVAAAPLALRDALLLTAFRNEQLARQGERYVQALAERQRAAAALKPTFDIFGRTTLRATAGSGSSHQSDLGFSGQYRLLTGMTDLRNVDAADARIRAERWLVLDLRESLLLQAARAYYETLRAERLADVLRASVDTQLARLDDARARNAVGFARPLDVAQIEAQVSRTRSLRIAAERQAREARAALALLTDADVASSPLTDGYAPPAEPRDAATLGALADAHRADVVAARNEAIAARSEVDAAIGRYAPALVVDLDALLLQSPDDAPHLVAGLIELRLPIFSAGAIEADVRAAWSRFRAAVLAHRLRGREVRRDVETALAVLRAAEASAAELDTQLAVARQTLALAEASYEAGLGTNLERIAAQEALLSAELDSTSAAFDVKFAVLALRRACGVLATDMLDAPLPELAEPERTVPTSEHLERAVAATGDAP